MQSRPLVIITTRLAPQICGVGSFSWLLNQHWPGGGAQNRFLVVDGAEKSQSELANAQIAEFGTDWRMLTRELESAGDVDVFLHYTGRGYSRFGCPLGLSAALQKWKQRSPRSRIFIFFHELPGRLPLTSKHFLPNFCNRRVVRKLAGLADAVITNTDEHIRTVAKLSPHTKLCLLPVPSTIEPVGSPPPDRARSEFVIFGLPFSRWQTLQAFDSHIRRWRQENLLTKLHLIGATDQKFDSRSTALLRTHEQDMIVRHGALDAARVSQLLHRAQFALTTADEATWTKSTTFMAYAAHGCNIVSLSTSPNEPYCWTIPAHEVGIINDSELRRRAEAMQRWYESHADWRIIAAKISELIETCR